ncbi:MAG: FtsX-like permease family protein [Balneola sp.]|nr:MAG: FtsX-like permease family protein [Balneola sp.]
MFNLENAVREWHKKLKKHPDLEPGVIEELETHLYDKIDSLKSEGLSEEEAFNRASSEIPGAVSSFASEFSKAKKRPIIKGTKVSFWMLIPNYFKVALRQLYRQKGYSIINILGLAVGIATTILIMMYVKHELSYDTFHTNSDRIYRLINENPTSGQQGIAKVNGPWGVTANENIPEVDNVTRFVFFTTPIVQRGETSNYEVSGFYADASVFDVFGYEMISGDPKTALVNPNSVALTEQVAEIYFPNEDPVGKSLTMDGVEYTVTALLEDIPGNTHISFRYLVSMSSLTHPERDDWIRWNQFYTYLLLAEEATPDVVAQKFQEILPTYISEDALPNYNASLQLISDIHLNSDLFREITANSNIIYVYVFSAIALLILLIACVNFTNLATAKAMNRAREIGVRKSAGALKSTLRAQFLGESIVYTAISSIFAIGLAIAALNLFNQITLQSFTVSDLFDFQLISWILILIVFIGILSGSYPAFLLSAFKPVQSLKGEIKISGSNTVRSGLIVFQFAITTALILATSVVIQQLNYVQNQDLGFDKEQLVILRIRDNSLREQADTFKEELLRNPNIINASISANFPGGTDYGIPSQPEGIPEEQRPPMRVLAVDHEFVETFGMKVAQGRSFSRDITTDAFGSVLINEEAARQLGWENPLDHRISIDAIGFGPAPVIGVLEDFHFRSFREAISPIMLFIPTADWYTYYTIRISPDNVEESLAHIQSTWEKFDPVNPFSSIFFDSYYQGLYYQEQSTQNLLNYSTLLAIIISAIGLFGLASFITEKRTKEIGIRKVLGASVREVVFMMAKQFTKFVAISLLIAIPVAYFGMGKWLESFAYKTNINAITILITAASVFGIAWVSVSYQSIKAALSNPIKSLRSE